jgi:arylsulfatase A-like enzyme
MRAPRIARIPRHMLVGAVAAFATAALHLGVVSFGRDVLGQFSWAWNSREVIWMLPLGYLVVYACISIPLGVLAALMPNGVSARATAWIWGTIVTFSLLLLFPRIHSLAWLVLSIGVGYQLSRVVANRPQATTRALARAGIMLAVLFAVLITAFEGRRALQARRAMTSLPSARSDAPNVILVIWDTARAKNFSLYGYERRTTPFLDSLARQAVVFDRAFVTAPWTLPSHASMLTGQYATAQSGDRMSPMDGTHRTLAEELREHGYATGAFVANLTYTYYSTGLHRGFLRYEDRKRTFGQIFLHTTLTQSTALQTAYRRITRDRWYGAALRALLSFDGRPEYDRFLTQVYKSGAEVTRDFLSWEARTKGPFFAFLNYFEAHSPHNAPDRARFGGAKLVDQYDGALFSLDRELERLVQELKRRGKLERTIIVVTSDHGEQFEEHGLKGHANSLYLELLHVPLVIYAPQHSAVGRRDSRVVSLRDLPRTILGVAGILNSTLPGAMLVQSQGAASDNAKPSPAIAEVSKGINDNPRNPTYHGDLTAVVDDSLHVIRDGKGDHHVYAYRQDPTEVNDLAVDPVMAAWASAHIDSLVRAFGLRSPNVTARAAARF